MPPSQGCLKKKGAKKLAHWATLTHTEQRWTQDVFHNQLKDGIKTAAMFRF